MDIWLSEAEIKEIDFADKPYKRLYSVKLRDGNSHSLVSAKGSNEINPDIFIPYSLVDKGIDNSLISVDGISDILIYQSEYVQCLDTLKNHGIPIDELIEVERVALTREQLDVLTSDKVRTKKIRPSEKKGNHILAATLLGAVALVAGIFYFVI